MTLDKCEFLCTGHLCVLCLLSWSCRAYFIHQFYLHVFPTKNWKLFFKYIWHPYASASRTENSLISHTEQNRFGNTLIILDSWLLLIRNHCYLEKINDYWYQYKGKDVRGLLNIGPCCSLICFWFPTAQIHSANHFFIPLIENFQPNICCAESLLLPHAFLVFKGANLDSGGETCMQCLNLHSFTSTLCRTRWRFWEK